MQLGRCESICDRLQLGGERTLLYRKMLDTSEARKPDYQQSRAGDDETHTLPALLLSPDELPNQT